MSSIPIGTKVFWDPYINGGYGGEGIVTMEQLRSVDWENLTAVELMNRLPAGIGFENVMNILIEQIAYLSKKTRELENEIADKVLLVDDVDTEPNR